MLSRVRCATSPVQSGAFVAAVADVLDEHAAGFGYREHVLLRGTGGCRWGHAVRQRYNIAGGFGESGPCQVRNHALVFWRICRVPRTESRTTCAARLARTVHTRLLEIRLLEQDASSRRASCGVVARRG